jgi:ABC-2 type transport system permease protein
VRVVLRSFAAFLRAAVGTMLQYRGEIILWAIWGLINPAVLYAIWSAAAESNVDQTLAGFSRGQFAAYYFCIMIIGHFTTAWDAYELGYLIRSGSLSPQLLRPILPIWSALAANMAYKITTLAFVGPMWALFFWIVRPTFEAATWQIVLGIVATMLAGLLNFLLGYVVALVSFWSPKLDAVGEAYFGIGMIFGGRFAPLAALPGILYQAAYILPFRWMYAFPAELMMGKIKTPAEALSGLTIQLVWLLGIVFVFRFGWKAAVKHYSAVSG